MTKVKVSFWADSPIKQKIYYDVHRVFMYHDGSVAIAYFDHVREVMECTILKRYYEIEIF